MHKTLLGVDHGLREALDVVITKLDEVINRLNHRSEQGLTLEERVAGLELHVDELAEDVEVLVGLAGLEDENHPTREDVVVMFDEESHRHHARLIELQALYEAAS